MSYPYLVFKTHRGFVVFSALVAGALQLVIIKAITAFDTTSILPAFLAQLPERLRVLVDETLISRFSIEGAAAFGFNHPMVIVLVAINAVLISARHVSGEIEDGTMELLLAHPVRRLGLLAWLWVVAGLGNLVVVGGALAGSLTGVAVFDTLTGSFSIKLVEIAVNLWLLSVLVHTGGLLAGVYATRGSRPGVWVAGVFLALYVLHFLSALWGALGVTAPVNIFTYYQPQKLVIDQASFARNAAVLGGITVVCLVLALRRFDSRDVPG